MERPSRFVPGGLRFYLLRRCFSDDCPTSTYKFDESALFHRNLSSTERNPAFSRSRTPRRTVLSDIFSSLAMVGMAGQHTPSLFALPRRYRYTAMARLGRSLC